MFHSNIINRAKKLFIEIRLIEDKAIPPYHHIDNTMGLSNGNSFMNFGLLLIAKVNP